MSLSDEDAQARREALDPARSFVVEALAGSGKTSLLTQRLLVLLARVKAPESVLAVTFTRKAAEELRGRVLAALASARGAAPDDAHAHATWMLARAVLAQDLREGWQLESQPGRLRLQTIDALAAGMARRAPLDAGLAAALTPVDDATPLYARAARETLQRLNDERFGLAVERALAVLDNDWARAEALLVDMLPRRDQWLARVGERTPRALAEHTLAAAVSLSLRALVALLPTRFHAELGEFARWAAGDDPDGAFAALADFDLQTLRPAACTALAALLLTAAGEVRKDLGRVKGLPAAQLPAFKARFADLRERLITDAATFCARLHAARALPEGRFDDAEWAAVQALLDLLTLAAVQLERVFASTGRCDFQAVAQSAQDALGAPDEPTELTLALDYRLEHLLIDECQDTSRSQHQLFETLVSGWSEGDGRTLFLVGDPRQSIYRFRQAEVGLFTRLIRTGQFASVRLHCLRLSANFRTCEPLIGWLNQTLPEVFATDGDELPAFGGLLATRPALADPAVSVHALPDGDPLAEASGLLALIQSVRIRRPTASIAVLVRGRSHLGALPAMLTAAGIPVAAAEVAPLSEVPAVGDLLALTRALLHLTDRIAWLALLRAPWCGVSLPGLVVVAEAAPQALIRERLRESSVLDALTDDDRQRVAALQAVLSRALRLVRRVPLARLVEQTWQDLGGPLGLAASDRRAAERYLALLRDFSEASPEFAPDDLAAQLATRYVPVPRETGNAVQLMTIHKAKGLEFDVVIVPALDRKVRADDAPLVVWHEMAALPPPALLMAPLPTPGATDTRTYAFVRDHEQAEQAAEARRLLYVALTRARDELHLCARRKLNKDGLVAAPFASSFLALLWPQLESAFVPTPTTAPVGMRPSSAPARRRRLATLPVAPPPLAPLARAADALAFDWASPVARHVGTVTHRLLQTVAEQGLDAWPPARVSGLRALVNGALRAEGVPGPALGPACERVLAALLRTLESPRGRWILSDQHQSAASELRLGTQLDGVVTDAVLDRSFIDADGVRWIVDFKTGEHQGGAPEAFMDSEVERYRGQLERYAALLTAMDPRPVQLALYFPLLDGWRAWAWRAGAAERSRR